MRYFIQGSTEQAATNEVLDMSGLWNVCIDDHLLLTVRELSK